MLDSGTPFLASRSYKAQIGKIQLPDGKPEDFISDAFSICERQNIEFGLPWLTNLARHGLASDETAFVYTARLSNDDFLACPIILKSRTKQASSLSTFYTSLFSPIVQSDKPRALLTPLFNYMANTENVTSLTLYPMDMGSDLFSDIQTSLSEAGWKGLHTFHCFGNWTHEVNGQSYGSYLESLSSRQRNTVKRKTRKFLEDGKGHFEIIEGGKDLVEGIAHFEAIYSSSWKQEEPYPAFIPGLFRLAADRGWLRLGLAFYDNVPVATQAWFVANGVAHIFKLAYRENYKQLSAGTVLTAHMMKHVMDVENVSLIDYLQGDDAYKRDWMSSRRDRNGIAAYNISTALGFTLYLIHTSKSLIKKLLPRPSR